MFASVTSVAFVGVEPQPVRVEVHVANAEKPKVLIVGLPDTAVREARERVRSAIQASGFRFPTRRVIVNLSPADLQKVGSAYDLPIALGLLAAERLIPPAAAGVVALGELALDGGLRPVRGALAAGVVAGRMGMAGVVPVQSVPEARLAGGEVRGARSLAHAVAVALGEDPGESAEALADPSARELPDIAVVRGQDAARRALEVAAAGGHHLLLEGPPGAGKTLLARSLPGILPDLTPEEELDVAKARAAAGRTAGAGSQPPFRTPHHSATPAAVLGGGSGVPVPGELTLAHRGVLFLDELGEFPGNLLDMLRQPIEEGRVHISRKGAQVTFPCRIQLVGATNPCPCGYREDRLVGCDCSKTAVERYRRRLSGPLLDRFDMHVVVPRVDAEDLLGPAGEPSALVRGRVTEARAAQTARGVLNREMSRSDLDATAWSADAMRRLRAAVQRSKLTARGWDRVRRVARTVADLAGSEIVEGAHLAEALSYREAA